MLRAPSADFRVQRLETGVLAGPRDTKKANSWWKATGCCLSFPLLKTKDLKGKGATVETAPRLRLPLVEDPSSVPATTAGDSKLTLCLVSAWSILA